MLLSGVGVYAGLADYSFEENIKYLKKAKDAGCTLVFSSAHINEAKLLDNDLANLINETIKLGMKLSLDISKPTFEKITLPDGIYSLRLDYGFTEDDIIKLSNEAPYRIELNASTYSIEKLERLIDKGLNTARTTLSFNFYPKKYTGHDIEFVYSKTQDYKSMGFDVYAFVNSHTGFRPPLYEGLPTVETHRYLDLLTSINELKLCGVDGIMFGDAYASDDELKLLNDNLDHYLNIKAVIANDYQYLYDNIYTYRIDSPSVMGRLNGTRVVDKVAPFNTVDRNRFDITVDNVGMKRYQGEVNIIYDSIEADERVNVVGKVYTSDFVFDELFNHPFKLIK